uniref:Uncharacterized protein n=1 Tax=Anguilla anguilla TaxID=7936 RepID=A0A0E9VR83_ANGAN
MICVYFSHTCLLLYYTNLRRPNHDQCLYILADGTLFACSFS